MLIRGVVDRVTDSSTFQGVVAKLRALDDPEDGPDGNGVEHWLPYGFTAVAKAGAEALVGYLGGDSDKAVVISVGDRRYRLTGLAEGEVALYDDQGQKVVLYRDRIEVESDKIVMNSSDVNLGGTGGAGVARNGDSITGTTDIAVVTGVTGAGITVTTATVTVSGNIDAGSATVKAVS